MQKKVRVRLVTILLLILSIVVGVTMILYALSNSIVFYYTPTELLTNNYYPSPLRIGGLVKNNSINRISINEIKFIIRDNKNEVDVYYKGALPMLFRDGQGTVVKGRFSDKLFIADELLVKHDENYKPPT